MYYIGHGGGNYLNGLELSSIKFILTYGLVVAVLYILSLLIFFKIYKKA